MSNIMMKVNVSKKISKQIIFSLFFVFLNLSYVWAIIPVPIQTALNTSTYTAIQLGADQSCSSFGFWTEDSSSYYLSSDSAGSDAILVPENTPLSITMAHGKNAILFYAKATAGTPNMAVVITQR